MTVTQPLEALPRTTVDQCWHHLIVVRPGPWGRDEYYDCAICPGMTASEVLQQLGLDGRHLVWFGRETQVLSPDAELTACLHDGARMWAF